MKFLSTTITVLALALLCAPTMAQDNADAKAEELRLAEAQLRQSAELMAQKLMAEKSGNIEVEVRLRNAERHLAEAALHVSDLSMAQLPGGEGLKRLIQASRGPVLGITISADKKSGAVEGVEVLGVSPGGAAQEAGLRSGDVITDVNGESLAADSSKNANAILLDFMQGVEEGDELSIEYLRDGNETKAGITPRPLENDVFAFSFNDGRLTADSITVAPNVRSINNFVWAFGGHGFGDMELVPLTARLGSYFGTEEGLLVVRAPDDEDLMLEDGDVILSIDGREPASISHAMRILRSYEGGEELKMEIMRDKRKRTVSIEVPDNRRSFNSFEVAPTGRFPARVKAVIADDERT